MLNSEVLIKGYQNYTGVQYIEAHLGHELRCNVTGSFHTHLIKLNFNIAKTRSFQICPFKIHNNPSSNLNVKTRLS